MRLVLMLSLITGSACAQPAPGRDPALPLMGAMAEMNHQMEAAPLTGDPDRDFVYLIVAHQRGAMDMAKAYLKTGKDPDIRRTAQTIMAEADKQVRFLRGWQAKHQPR